MATTTGGSSTLPSQNTVDYWIYARNRSGFDRGEYVKTDNCGKWLVFADLDDLDRTWAIIKRATEEGQLGHSAKVSTELNHREQPSAVTNGKTTGVICVYTYDWTDKKDVMRVREALRELGFTQKLCYKSDADTLAGKYVHLGHKRIGKYYA